MLNKENTQIVYITKRAISIIVFLLLVVSTLPILYMGKYNVMSADDYLYGQRTYKVWSELGISGMFPLLHEAIVTTYDNWMGWGGNYTSIFFTSLQPGVFSADLVFLNTIILIGLILISNYIACATLGKFILNDMWISKLIFCIGSIVMIQWIPSAVEGYFWFNGAFYNIVGSSLGLIFLVKMWKEIFVSEKIHIVSVMALIILAIIIAGANYTYIMVVFVVLGMLNLYMFLLYKKDNKKKYFVLMMTLLFIIFMFLNILAPGNLNRMGQTTQTYSMIETVLISFRYGRIKIIEYISYQHLVPILFLLPILPINKIKLEIKFQWLVVSLVASYCIFSASFSPTLYSLSTIGPVRTQNIYYIVLCQLFYVNAIFWCIWIRKCIKKYINITEVQKNQLISNYGIAIVVIAGFFITRETIMEMHVFTAIKYITNGEAQIYKDEHDERLISYLDETQEVLILEDTSVKPTMLFYGDIGPDEGHWINQWVSNYYGKEMVRLIEAK